MILTPVTFNKKYFLEKGVVPVILVRKYNYIKYTLKSLIRDIINNSMAMSIDEFLDREYLFLSDIKENLESLTNIDHIWNLTSNEKVIESDKFWTQAVYLDLKSIDNDFNIKFVMREELVSGAAQVVGGVSKNYLMDIDSVKVIEIKDLKFLPLTEIFYNTSVIKILRKVYIKDLNNSILYGKNLKFSSFDEIETLETTRVKI